MDRLSDSWMQANADFQLNVDDEATALVHYLDFDPSWAAFCTRMRQPTQYGDHLTLIAAAECTLSQIVVFTSQATSSCVCHAASDEVSAAAGSRG